MTKNNWHSLWCVEVNAPPAIIVLFGAAGDLAGRKLYPALFALYKQNLIDESTKIIGCARRNWSRQEYSSFVKGFLDSDEQLPSFLEMLEFINCDYDNPSSYLAIKKLISQIEKIPSATPRNHLFYLALPASIYENVTEKLAESALLTEKSPEEPWRHVILEKPFGYDSLSAKKLIQNLQKHLKERQIYRIDHYLGKETVQNITMLRFANIIFEPLWNNQFIDSVQITVAESLGVENRGKYFDRAGLLRDMFQNHMLELLSLAAMEQPARFDATDVRNEKLKLIHSIRAEDFHNPSASFIRGQYSASKDFRGYREEPNVSATSTTETFVAAKIHIDNWRWSNVPFYLRSGKRMERARSEIVINFKSIPHSIFSPMRASDLENNRLTLKVYPEEGMSLSLEAKERGPKLCMGTMSLDYNYPKGGNDTLDAYARLLLDALLGDQTLFIRDDIIQSSWQLFTPVLEYWEKNPDKSPLYGYSAGSDGPLEAEKLLLKDGREWQK